MDGYPAIYLWREADLGGAGRPVNGAIDSAVPDGQACWLSGASSPAVTAQLGHRQWTAFTQQSVGDLRSGQGRGGQGQLQPQAARAAFQAWTPNNHVLLVEARGN